MFDLKSFSDDRLVDWMKEFVSKLKSHSSSLGVSDSEVDSVDRDYMSMSKLVTEERRIQRADVDPQIKQEYTNYKDLVKNGPSDELKKKFPTVFTSTATKTAPGVIPRVFEFAERLNKRSDISHDMKEKLGIAGLNADSMKDAITDQGQFGEWFGNFVHGVKEHQTRLNVSDSELKSLESDYQASHHLVKSTETAQEEGASGSILNQLMGYKDLIVNGPSDGLKRAVPGILGMFAAPGILSRVTGTIDKLKGKPRFDELIGKDMGISGVERAREAVGAGAGARASTGARHGAGPGHERPVESGGGKWKWILPVLALLGIGLLMWGLSSRKPHQVAYQTPKMPKVTTPAVPGSGPSTKATKPKPSATTAAALAVSDMRFVPGAKGGTLAWTTNKPATGQIEYGKTPSYELGRAPKTLNTGDKYFVTKHNTGLQGLSPGTKYYVRAIAQDKAGKKAMSKPYSFTLP